MELGTKKHTFQKSSHFCPASSRNKKVNSINTQKRIRTKTEIGFWELHVENTPNTVKKRKNKMDTERNITLWIKYIQKNTE